MDEISRRSFLRWLGAGIGLVAGEALLRSCGLRPLTPSFPGLTPARTASPEGTAESVTSTSAPTETTSSIPDVAVARGGEPEDLIRRAMDALGGIGRFVRPGQDVVIKPNICVAYHSYEYAATTNPWLVGALVRMCLEAGVRRVRVMDHPFGGTPEDAYVVSGIREQVEAAGGQMEVMAPFKFVEVKLPGARDLTRCAIYDEILKADVLINVPIAKHHSLARLTLGMKNLMGTIWDRPVLHRNLGQRLADLAGYIRPTLTVVDAIRILTANGPTGGDLADVRRLDTVIVSPDIVAADSYAATLFGLRPEDLDYVRAGVAMGLGRSDLENLRIAVV